MSSKASAPQASPFVLVNSEAKSFLLRRPTKTVSFPLSQKCLDVCEHLDKEVRANGGAAGLAANQLGYDYAVAAIHVLDSEALRSFRDDFSDALDTILINPSYTPLTQETRSDWEACFSVPDVAGFVPRYISIAYDYQTIRGEHIHQTATGFLARVLQHEIDHLKGVVFTDLIGPEDTLTLEKYRILRANKINRSPL